MKRALFILLLLLPLLATPAQSHEVRPSYLEMQEVAPDVFSVLWRVPALGDMRLGLYARLPESCTPAAPPRRAIENNAYMERWTAKCEGGLGGQPIRVDGLPATRTDVLVRIGYSNGSTEIARLTPRAPQFTAAGAQSSFDTGFTYLLLGIEHILWGIDHLAFVLALLLLIGDRWTLLKTITAFTVAHSITLTGAALGFFSLPQQPVETAIALSIAFVARELVREQSGTPSLTHSAPWLVAFAFGLLHGFGFAGALSETGLPQTDVPVALLAFNIGVEAGQLAFVAAALLSWTVLTSVVRIPAAPARVTAAYAIGTAAMVWLAARIGQMTGFG